MLLVNLVYANLEYQKETPPSLREIDHQCWEVSSHGLVEMKKLKVADTVIALWDFMMFLKESPKPKHNDLFNDLAQNFWDIMFEQSIALVTLLSAKGAGDYEPQVAAAVKQIPGGHAMVYISGFPQLTAPGMPA
ncbi:hypothetical protein EK904_005717 [Melospiza melodia maxima]|nr:hypothetical protein EK904_005717 [Melospiza melodia maxima]